jgi:predicted transcriptional regulator
MCMTVRGIVDVLEGSLVTGENLLDLDIDSACGADLMSDVMAFVKDNVVLLTGLVNPQSIRTADLMDIKVIVFVRGKALPADMISEAERNGMAIITTKYSMFLACGRLYEAGIRAGGTHSLGGS